MIGSEDKVVLFDGICNYCNAMVNFAIRNDKKPTLKFAPLQSETGQQLRNHYHIPKEIDSVILVENDKVYTYSDAAIRITRHLRWPARMLYGLIIIPKFIREPLYKWIAKNRYKWFGRKNTCMVPNQDLRSRFL